MSQKEAHSASNSQLVLKLYMFVMNHKTQVFSGNSEKCYSVDVDVLVGSHIHVTAAGIWIFCDNRMREFYGVYSTPPEGAGRGV